MRGIRGELTRVAYDIMILKGYQEIFPLQPTNGSTLCTNKMSGRVLPHGQIVLGW